MSGPSEIWDRCPICRARLKESPMCPRCGVDFSPALSRDEESGNLAGLALYELRRGRREEAFRYALRAAEEHSTPETMRVLAIAASAMRHFNLALTLWKSIKEDAGEELNEKKAIDE